MELRIAGTPNEIADLVGALQDRQGTCFTFSIDPEQLAESVASGVKRAVETAIHDTPEEEKENGEE